MSSSQYLTMDSVIIPKIAGTLGIISTTTFWSMNFTVNHLTFPALLLGDVPKSSVSPSGLSKRFLIPSTDELQVPRAFLTRQWQEIYWRGHHWGLPSAILSGLSFLNAAYFSAAASKQRYLYIAAAITAVSVVPWTLMIILPINKELHRRGDAQRLGADKEHVQEVKGDGRDLITLLGDWVSYNNVRASLAMMSTFIGVAALLQ